jgi:hypothetical protein
LEDAVGVAGGVGEAGASGVAGVTVTVGIAVGGCVGVIGGVTDVGGACVGATVWVGLISATTSVTGISDRAQARLAIRTANAGSKRGQAKGTRRSIISALT